MITFSFEALQYLMNQLLPHSLLQDLKGLPGFDEADFVQAHEHAERITSIRLNTNKIDDQQKLSFADLIDDKVAWCRNAFYLKQRPQFVFDPLLHAGAYYVQEASSMFLHEVLKQTIGNNTNKIVLDLCAAPGGKSTLLSSYFINGLVVANEVIKTRVPVLYENITKWGNSNVVITSNDAKDFKKLPNFFDVIVIDAPCSGSGLFRKDKDAVDEWSTDNVKLCSQRQQRILADAFDCLKKDGLLIYSTCSYSREENEDVLDWCMNTFQLESIQLTLNNEWNITETNSSQHHAFGYRFWPHKTKGEGFFIAAFTKKDGDVFKHTAYKSSYKTKESQALKVNEYLKDADSFILTQKKEYLIGLPRLWHKEIVLLQEALYVRKAGIMIGEQKGKDIVPHHELAVSIYASGFIQHVELSYDETLAYLRRQPINVSIDVKGWCLCTFQHIGLGWVKVLHNRVNNYYPTEWRILKN